jgi:hypothetical protein
MTEKAVKWVLYVSGGVTLLAGLLQFVAPTPLLHAQGLQIGDPAGMFFARHWGLLVLCIGALMIHAARRPDIRRPIVLAAAAEKFGMAVMMAMNWSEPALRGLRPAAVFDGACAVIFLVYLLRRQTVRAAQG